MAAGSESIHCIYCYMLDVYHLAVASLSVGNLSLSLQASTMAHATACCGSSFSSLGQFDTGSGVLYPNGKSRYPPRMVTGGLELHLQSLVDSRSENVS